MFANYVKYVYDRVFAWQHQGLCSYVFVYMSPRDQGFKWINLNPSMDK